MIRPLIFVLALLSPALYAQPVSYVINTEKTPITLSWHAFGGILSWANLNGVTGNVTLDPKNEFSDRIEVTIPVSTLVASNRLLTWQLKSDMFFDAARYPTIQFNSTRIVTLGDGHFRVFGSLKVRDITRPVILEATLEEHKAQESISLHATTAISRSAYQMDKFAMVVDDRINIKIEIQASAS
ncbi:YceI family protein [Lelliottia wanjuensis]|uniref:YceI family protein n=1 Tax=Lelliottia wanjuensis TaxID=3050585 RepID=UPI00254D23FA|nr:YceI family protein [Lelliottia sp. V86_10]MDK9584915.1 YceI family protein [Lelliottia sp. V86_10]